MTDKWAVIAERLGYKDSKEMWEGLYKDSSISKLATQFSISPWAVRKALNEAGVKLKGRGGPQAVKLKCVTPEIAADIKARGLTEVAISLGISRYSLLRHHKNYLRTLEETPQE